MQFKIGDQVHLKTFSPTMAVSNILIMLFIMVACDSSTRMGIIFVNDSNLDLRVEHGFGDSDTIQSVEPGMKATIHDSHGPRYDSNLENAAVHIRLFSADSLLYEQDPLIPEAWVENWVNDDYVTFTLTITNDSLAIL